LVTEDVVVVDTAGDEAGGEMTPKVDTMNTIMMKTHRSITALVEAERSRVLKLRPLIAQWPRPISLFAL